MSELKVCSVTKSFDGKRIIEDISLTLKERELVSIIGLSGGGKTTLFHVIAGLMLPDSGSVFLDQEEITGRPGKVSYMLQKDLLLPYRTIEDNAALPLLIRGVPKKEARNKVSAFFKTFGLEGTEKRYPHELSGGMRQRAALMRTYMFSGKVMLLDEPFSALDSITKGEIHAWYLRIVEELGLSALLITHDIDEALLLSDRIFILAGRPGRFVEEIRIETKKPRPEDFDLSQKFLNYKREILKAIKG